MVDIEVLSEVYSALKQYIPAKDRQEAADNLMGIMVDLLSDDDFREFGTTDKILLKSYKEFAIDDEDTDTFDDE